jgi:hypothetical protein
MLFELRQMDFVAVTADNWQSNSVNTYLGTTCHYIDSNFTIASKNLSLRHMVNAKTAENLYETLTKILNDWSILDKVYTKYFNFKEKFIIKLFLNFI